MGPDEDSVAGVGQGSELSALVSDFCLPGTSLRGNDVCLTLWQDGSDATYYLWGTFKMNSLTLNGLTFCLPQDPVASQNLAVSEKDAGYSFKEDLFLLQNPRHPCVFLSESLPQILSGTFICHR